MAGINVTIEVSTDAIRRIARQVLNLGEDPRDLLEIAGQTLYASTIRHFDEERGPGGVPWPKSKRAEGEAPNYRGQKIAGKTLTDSSDLRDSVRYEVRPLEVEIGADGLKNPIKALANQFGSHRTTTVAFHTRVVNSAFGVPLPQPTTQFVSSHVRITNIPARPFIGADDQDKADVTELWLDHLKGLFR